MSCTPAPSCRAALDEATVLFPARHKASDGICASSQHHQQNPNSDHETGDAWDLTHDLANGCDVDVLFDRIVRRRDPRVKYLIRNKRILRSYDKPGIPAWTWANYTGSNPHDKHGHCSILPDARHNVSPWFNPPPPPIPQPQPEPPQQQEDDDMIRIYDLTFDNDPVQYARIGNVIAPITCQQKAELLEIKPKAVVEETVYGPNAWAAILNLCTLKP